MEWNSVEAVCGVQGSFVVGCVFGLCWVLCGFWKRGWALIPC